MKEEELNYIKSTLQFALDNGEFEDHDKEIIYNSVTNSINTIDNYLEIIDKQK